MDTKKIFAIILAVSSLLTSGSNPECPDLSNLQEIRSLMKEVLDNEYIKSLNNKDSALVQNMQNNYDQVCRELDSFNMNPTTIEQPDFISDSSSNKSTDSFWLLNWFFESNALYAASIGICGIGYAAIKYKLYKAEKYLAHPQLLSSFRNDLSMEELFSIPKDVITEWILEEIQERYPDTNPVKTFYKEVQEEEQQLKKYLTTYLNLKDLSWFFDVSTIEDIPDRLRVLEHLKNLVLIWEIESSMATVQAEQQTAAV